MSLAFYLAETSSDRRLYAALTPTA